MAPPYANATCDHASMQLVTDRLVLRRFCDADLEPFAAMNADPAVMEHFVAPLTRAESDGFVAAIERAFARDGFGLWAVEAATGFVGFVGLNRVRFTAPFVPAVEVGWRLAQDAWGHGYATEAATAVLDDAFGRVGLSEVVSFTIPANVRSVAVMERLGMTHDPADDFDHPRVMIGHPHRRHVLYRMSKRRWIAAGRAGTRGTGT